MAETRRHGALMLAAALACACTPLARGFGDAAADTPDALTDAPPRDVATDVTATDVTATDASDGSAPDVTAMDVAAADAVPVDAPRNDAVSADAADVGPRDTGPVDAGATDVARVDAPMADVPRDVSPIDVVAPDVVAPDVGAPDVVTLDVPTAADVVDAPSIPDVPADRPGPDVFDAGRCETTSPARLIAPLSGSRVSSRRPLLRWELPPTATGATIEYCADRACSTVVGSESATGASLRTARADLLDRQRWWRVRPTRSGSPCGAVSPAWSMTPDGRADVDGYPYRPLPDFNGDGRTDAYISGLGASGGAGVVYVFAGQPSGLPATPTLRITAPASGDSFGTPTTGDFNGDGLTDLAVAQGNQRMGNAGRVWSFLSDGVALGAAPREHTPPTAGATYFGLFSFSGDFNGDGYADLAVASGLIGTVDMNGGRVSIYLGSPTGLAGAAAQTIPGIGGAGTGFGNSGAVVDVDADGYDDLLVNVYTGTSRTWVLHRGGPSGLTQDARPITSIAGQSIPSGGAGVLGDITGDGFVDYGTVVQSGGVWRALVAAGGPSVTPGTSGLVLPLADAPADASRLHGADLTGDGRADLVLLQNVGGVSRIYVYPRQASDFAAPLVVTAGAVEPAFTGPFTTGDYNGDGWYDLFAGHPGSGGAGAYSLVLGANGGPSMGGARGVPQPDADANMGFRLAWRRPARPTVEL